MRQVLIAAGCLMAAMPLGCSRAAPAATTAASPEKASRPFAVTFPVSDNR